jgi:hypothetical protein
LRMAGVLTKPLKINEQVNASKDKSVSHGCRNLDETRRQQDAYIPAQKRETDGR